MSAAHCKVGRREGVSKEVIEKRGGERVEKGRRKERGREGGR